MKVGFLYSGETHLAIRPTGNTVLSAALLQDRDAKTELRDETIEQERNEVTGEEKERERKTRQLSAKNVQRTPRHA